MQTLTFTFPAGRRLAEPVQVGVVASGDLEILVTPHPDAAVATVTVRTSVDGFGEVWERLLARSFDAGAYAARYLVNDSGATPGMVRLRLDQAHESAREAGPS